MTWKMKYLENCDEFRILTILSVRDNVLAGIFPSLTSGVKIMN